MSGAQVHVISKAEACHAYESAFHRFSEQVRRLQTLTNDPHPSRAAIEAALVDVEKARALYDCSRDEMARVLLPVARGVEVPCEDTPEALNERVRGIAEILWESAGRPEGTADEDWRLAEQIVKRAAAAA